jgi:hypothetical protein
MCHTNASRSSIALVLASLVSVIALFTTLLTTGGVAAAQTAGAWLIPAGSSWTYWDQQADPPPTWTTSYDPPATFHTGDAPFGYGIGGEATIINRLDPPHVSDSFRRKVEVDDVSLLGDVEVHLVADDGALVYVNGVEAVRDNMSTTSIDPVAASEADSGQLEVRNYSISPSLFTDGTNIVAVRLAQESASDTDSRFDLTMSADLLTTPASPAPGPAGFVHPGVAVGRAQLDFVKAKVAAGAEPWKSAVDKMLGSGGSRSTSLRPKSQRYSSLDYQPVAVPVITAATSGGRAYDAAHPELGLVEQGGQEQIDDATAALTDALLWYYTGDQAYAFKAIQIMNAWSSTLKQIAFDQPRRLDTDGSIWENGKLQAAWGGPLWATAAEIIRYSNAGWAPADILRMASMLTNVFVPLTIDGWTGGANWLMSCAEATIDIGVFTDNRTIFDAGVAYWRTVVPSTIYLSSDGPTPVPPSTTYTTADQLTAYWRGVYVNGLQGETLRDLSHMELGLGAMSNGASTATIQGVHLFDEQQTRLVAGYELNAGFVNAYLDEKERLGASPPAGWIPPGWPGAPGTFRAGGIAYTAGWEPAYDYYVRVKGIAMPQLQRLNLRLRPQPSAMQLSWSTALYAR